MANPILLVKSKDLLTSIACSRWVPVLDSSHNHPPGMSWPQGFAAGFTQRILDLQIPADLSLSLLSLKDLLRPASQWLSLHTVLVVHQQWRYTTRFFLFQIRQLYALCAGPKQVSVHLCCSWSPGLCRYGCLSWFEHMSCQTWMWCLALLVLV